MGKFKTLAAMADEYEQNLCTIRARRDMLLTQLDDVSLSTAQYHLRKRIMTLNCMISSSSAAISQMQRHGK